MDSAISATIQYLNSYRIATPPPIKGRRSVADIQSTRLSIENPTVAVNVDVAVPINGPIIIVPNLILLCSTFLVYRRLGLFLFLYLLNK